MTSPDDRDHGPAPWTRSLDDVECRCPLVRFGTYVSDSRNWNPDCLRHGVGTDWYEANMKDRLRKHDRRIGRVIDREIDPGDLMG